jgi:branched-chain amino acid transport system ATP-binding protein
MSKMNESLKSESTLPLLQADSVSKFFGSLAALSNVSLRIEQGGIVGLIGPNGAGKTTLLNSISGIYNPDRGQIQFMGRRIDGLRPDQINALGIARTYQLVELFTTLSVLENVMVGRHSKATVGFISKLLRLPSSEVEEREIREVALRCLELVGLEAKASDPCTNLPLGERKLLELARALSSEPKVLLIDEPAGGLSASEKTRLGEYLSQIRNNGTAILLIEHDMKFVMSLCDHVIVLNHGEKIAEGPPEHIRKNKEVILAYLGEEQ